jgi:hypothetical protein
MEKLCYHCLDSPSNLLCYVLVGNDWTNSSGIWNAHDLKEKLCKHHKINVLFLKIYTTLRYTQNQKQTKIFSYFFSTYVYSHGHGISSVVVIQLTLAVKQVLYISNPTLEFLTWMSKTSLVAF